MCNDHISCIVSTCFPFLDICADQIYFMAFTSHAVDARTTHFPYIALSLTNGVEGVVRLFDQPGKDFYAGAGDLWRIPISDFGFSGSTCVTYDSVSQVAIRAGGNDGWKPSILVTVLDIDGVSQPLTSDLFTDRWIDTPSQYEFVLTKV